MKRRGSKQIVTGERNRGPKNHMVGRSVESVHIGKREDT